MSIIRLNHVTKSFGELKAVNDVTITIEEGKIYGLLGRNGAGKSTLLNLISNRLFADTGEITIDEESVVENDKALAKMYCMSDKNLYPDTIRIKDIFKLSKTYYPNFDEEYANRLSAMYKLDIKKKVKTLSTGYSSIYKIIIALSCNAPIVFFDEPVLGLDAHHREMFYHELLLKYANNQSTYIISTHLIEEAAGVIEKVIILKDGKIIMNEDTEKVLASGYAVSGAAAAVDSYCAGKEILGADTLGGLKTAYIKGTQTDKLPDGLEKSKLDLQKLFIELTNI